MFLVVVRWEGMWVLLLLFVKVVVTAVLGLLEAIIVLLDAIRGFWLLSLALGSVDCSVSFDWDVLYNLKI